MAFRRRAKSHPLFSQEFLIHNHADIGVCLVLSVLIALMFEVRHCPPILRRPSGEGVGGQSPGETPSTATVPPGSAAFEPAVCVCPLVRTPGVDGTAWGPLPLHGDNLPLCPGTASAQEVFKGAR